MSKKKTKPRYVYIVEGEFNDIVVFSSKNKAIRYFNKINENDVPTRRWRVEYNGDVNRHSIDVDTGCRINSLSKNPIR